MSCVSTFVYLSLVVAVVVAVSVENSKAPFHTHTHTHWETGPPNRQYFNFHVRTMRPVWISPILLQNNEMKIRHHFYGYIWTASDAPTSQLHRDRNQRQAERDTMALSLNRLF